MPNKIDRRRGRYLNLSEKEREEIASILYPCYFDVNTWPSMPGIDGIFLNCASIFTGKNPDLFLEILLEILEIPNREPDSCKSPED